MLSITDAAFRMCDGVSRREAMRVGGLSSLGLSLPHLMASRAQATVSHGENSAGFGKARSVILFWLLGGAPQHESWDPKPSAPSEIRGEFSAIDSVVPGVQIGELMPKSATLVDKLAILRAVVTKDQAHSSSGYQMLTGVPHVPLSQENVTSRAPNLAPSHAAIMRALRPDRDGLPSSIALPYHIANDGEIIWPGQMAGVLGRQFDPWQLYCDPSQANFRVPDLALQDDVAQKRFALRRRLLSQLDAEYCSSGQSAEVFSQKTQQAFDLLAGTAGQKAFDMSQESSTTKDRYGRYRFGQSCLLARRLVESGVSLIQVNWTRVDGQPNNGTWDTHSAHCKSLKSFLMPMMDQSFSALISDLDDRGLLDETLVVWVSEFGHTPKINANAGRDHWGNCFSIAMAGGGIRGGMVHGESDSHAAFPVTGIVSPADITATIFYCLGYSPDTTLHEQTGRPFPLSRGKVIEEII